MAYAEVLTALADPTRRRIFEAIIEKPKSVGTLAAGLPVSRPAVSQHLKVLESAGLATSESQGTRRLFFFKREGLNELRKYLEGFWSTALSGYATEVDRRVKRRTGERRA